MFEQRSLSTLLERQIGGGTPPRSNPAFWNGPIPWASVKDFEDASLTLSSTAERISQSGLDASTANLIPAGTPLVCTRMAVGRCAITTQPVAINQDVRALTPKAEVQPRYLLRLLDFLRPVAESQAVGSTVKGIRTSDYLAIKVPVAPAIEQPVIASILDTLDTQIEKTQALIAKLEQVKEGLLHDLLTRGVDENGELRPSAEEAPKLYKASALGLMPRNWSVRTVEDVVESMIDGPFGSSLKTSHYVAEPGVRVVRLQNINRGWYDDKDRAYIRNVHATSLSRNLVHAGDLLVASLGDTNNPAGRACLYPADLPPAINKADCFRIRGLPNSASNAYLMLALNAGSASRQIRGNLQGVTLQRVNLRKLKSVVIPVPQLGEQSRICERFATVSDRKVQEAATLEILAALKSGLMDDLLTGRVRVTPLL